jgi:hypothetical protein
MGRRYRLLADENESYPIEGVGTYFEALIALVTCCDQVDTPRDLTSQIPSSEYGTAVVNTSHLITMVECM